MTPVIATNELISPARHLFLSPHYDDIALSCGGTAALLAASGKPAEIALIFGDHPDPAKPLSPFAKSLHRQWGMDAAEVIAGRRAEEAAATALLGASDHYLPFRDAPYREANYSGDNELFGTVKAEESGLPAAIAASLRLPSTDKQETRIYAPLAIGYHVDHQHAFTCGFELASHGWDVWFYEDLPYALKAGSLERRQQTLPASVQPSHLVEVGEVWDRKIDAIMAYPSQLGVIFGYVDAGHSRQEIDAEMLRYSESFGNGSTAERFWKVQAA